MFANRTIRLDTFQRAVEFDDDEEIVGAVLSPEMTEGEYSGPMLWEVLTATVVD